MKSLPSASVFTRIIGTIAAVCVTGCSGGYSEPADGRDLRSVSSAVQTVGNWTTVVSPVPGHVSSLELLTDGSVLVGNGDTAWYKLTPDNLGSYEHGTWSTVASSHLSRLYMPSTMLKDGRYWTGGGEYINGMLFQGNQSTVEIYDPVADTWLQGTDMPSPIGDTAASILPDGRVLCSSYSTSNVYIYDSAAGPTTNPWTQSAPIGTGGIGDEKGWTLLQNGTVLDAYDSGSVFDPALGTWHATGALPSTLESGGEVGPMSLLYSGKAIQFGAASAPDVGHTGVYDPNTNNWTSGPDAPDGKQFADSPACVLTNGHVLVTTGVGLSGYSPSAFWEYDPGAPLNSAFIPVPYPPTLGTIPVMLQLPNGQVLQAFQGATTCNLYTPVGTPQSAWRPNIASISTAASLGAVTLSGTQLNGLTTGASFGDDFNMATNYPLVWVTDTAGNVNYARTLNFDQMTPRPTTSGSCQFAMPTTLADGTYNVHLSANGVEASNTVPITLGIRATSLSGGLIVVNPGSTTTWNVNLSAAAPAGGIVVDLSSLSTGVATVPSSVTVPAGATSAPFVVTSVGYGSSKIYATARTNLLRAATRPFGNAILYVTGPNFPSSGNVASWDVVFNRTPASAGAVVNLWSSNTSVVTVPNTVTVPSGAIGAFFPVTFVGQGLATITAYMQGTAATGPIGFSVTSVSGPADPAPNLSATWTVVISDPPDVGGAIVSLSSSNTSRATVPSSVTVPSGSTSATFPVTYVAPGQATITASVIGSSQTGSFGVQVSSVTANPTTITGIGNSSTGTVTLTGNAPPGGIVVTLTGVPNVVTVPQSVTILAGSQVGTFGITAIGAGFGSVKATAGNVRSVLIGVNP